MSGGEERPASRGRPIDAALSPAILQAVLRLLAEGGYTALTTAAVARRAGVSTATLYRRWPSKRDLVLDSARLLAAEESTLADTGSTADDLRMLLAQKRRILSGLAGAALIALLGESAHDVELAELVRASVLDPTRAHLEEIFRRAVARGETRILGADAAAHLVVGMMLSRLSFSRVPSRPEALSAVDVETLVRALAGTSAETGAGPA